jgi:hypothetical protein
MLQSVTRRDAVLARLVPAGSDFRFADLVSSLRVEAEARYGLRRCQLLQATVDRTAALLRAATKNYERNVLAWYALGRVTEARSARQEIVSYQRALAAETMRLQRATAVRRKRQLPGGTLAGAGPMP